MKKIVQFGSVAGFVFVVCSTAIAGTALSFVTKAVHTYRKHSKR